jgi:hypothetical protein
MKVDLHPLALEDVFHSRDESLSKADYHAKHLFLRILCHELGESDMPLPVPSSETVSGLPLTTSPMPFPEAEFERMIVVTPLALFGDLRKAYHYFKEDVITRNALKVCYFLLHIVVLDLEVSLQDVPCLK